VEFDQSFPSVNPRREVPLRKSASPDCCLNTADGNSMMGATVPT
jgi:hypothetical protein